MNSAIDNIVIVNERGTKQVSLDGVFRDADGDDLNITAASNNDAVASVSVASDGSVLTVTAQSRGTATVTVRVDDGHDDTVKDTFKVTVKAAPTVALAIANVLDLEAGKTQDVSLS